MLKLFAASWLFILGTLAQSVFQDVYKTDDTKLDETKLTVEYKPNPNFKVCQCDMVQGSCDPFCCCDEEDCPGDFVKQWQADSLCANETYDSTKQIINDMENCFESDENEYNFNRYRGLQTYYSPFANLFCIRFNNAPEMGSFYSANITKPTPAELRVFEQSKDHSMRKLTFQEEQGDVGERNYRVGEKMKSKVELTYGSTVDTSSRTQYSDAFPFPRADSYGNCNNFGSVYFLQNDQSTCQQMVTLKPANQQSDCDTVLNAEYYTKFLKVFTGIRGTSNQVKSVETVNNIWTYNNGIYTKQPASTSIKSESSDNSGQCTCKNALKEIEYTFELEREDGKNFYSFNKATTSKSKIKAQVILYEEDQTIACGEKIGVQQSFKINFQTKPGLVQKKSGNPGYMDGYPLLLGKQSAQGKTMQSYIDGFQIIGADKNGKCFQTLSGSGVPDFDDPVVKFNTDLSYGCSLSFNYAEFEDFCKNAGTPDKVKNYPIFKNLDEMQAVGVFGNADIQYIKDWQYLNNDPSFFNLGKTQWFAGNKTCKINDNLQFKVVYHDMGYGEHPQRYIIDMKRYSKAEYWQWPSDEIPHARRLNYDLLVNVQYVDYQNIFQDEDGFIPVPSNEFDKMMFYPAFLRSFTHASHLRFSLVHFVGAVGLISSLLLIS